MTEIITRYGPINDPGHVCGWCGTWVPSPASHYCGGDLTEIRNLPRNRTERALVLIEEAAKLLRGEGDR